MYEPPLATQASKSSVAWEFFIAVISMIALVIVSSGGVVRQQHMAENPWSASTMARTTK
jgi:hypothetical protein